jgi:hypothetical protein
MVRLGRPFVNHRLVGTGETGGKSASCHESIFDPTMASLKNLVPPRGGSRQRLSTNSSSSASDTRQDCSARFSRVQVSPNRTGYSTVAGRPLERPSETQSAPT